MGRLNNVEKLWTNSQQTDQQEMAINVFLLITIIGLAYILNKCVSESLKEKIVSGKYVNMVLLLIPKYEQIKENKDCYRDARLNRSLSIEEFIVAFGKY